MRFHSCVTNQHQPLMLIPMHFCLQHYHALHEDKALQRYHTLHEYKDLQHYHTLCEYKDLQHDHTLHEYKGLQHFKLYMSIKEHRPLRMQRCACVELWTIKGLQTVAWLVSMWTSYARSWTATHTCDRCCRIMSWNAAPRMGRHTCKVGYKQHTPCQNFALHNNTFLVHADHQITASCPFIFAHTSDVQSAHAMLLHTCTLEKHTLTAQDIVGRRGRLMVVVHVCTARTRPSHMW